MKYILLVYDVACLFHSWIALLILKKGRGGDPSYTITKIYFSQPGPTRTKEIVLKLPREKWKKLLIVVLQILLL